MIKKVITKLIFLRYILLILVIFVILYLVSTEIILYAHNRYILERIESQTYRVAYTYSYNQFDQTNPDFLDACRTNHFVYNSCIVVFDKNSNITFDSQDIFPNSQKNFQDPVIDAALMGHITTSKTAFSRYFEENAMAVAMPITIGNQVEGVLINVTIAPNIPEARKIIFFISVTISLLIGGILYLFTYLYRRRSRGIVNDFTKMSKEISSGNFDVRINEENITSPEFFEIAKNINSMAMELSKLEEMRRDFIANISHDFRSPLTSIRGFVAAILDGTISTDNQEKYLNIVLDESERLTRLTNDLLILSQMQSNNYPLEQITFDIHEVIKKVAMQFEQKIAQKKLQLSVPSTRKELLVFADINQIHRVLYNIIDNAIKFSDENGEVIVDTLCVDNKVKIFIHDKGQGISKEAMSHIWDRFYKYDKSRGKDKKGIGLGLSIVKEILRAHDEKIYVTSDDRKGTTFTFTLPLAKKSTTSSPPIIP